MRALVVAAGVPPARAALDRAWPGWADGVGLVIAADAGATTADMLGLRPDLAVGDFDSIAPDELDRLRAAGIPVEVAPIAKDESDTELAVRAALDRGADALTIVGGLGGRPDHLVANIALLALPDLAGLEAVLLDGSTRVRMVRPGPGHELAGRVSDLVSLIPFGPGVDGVTTEGLAWPLDDEALPVGPARGLSNVRVAAVARVSIRSGILVVIETVSPAADL
ncbi:MAG: thiamine diphosphokinase [Chloroflexota bacterium]